MPLSAANFLFASVSLSQTASWVLAALAVFFFFSLSIFVHEGGHFLAAKALGMRADAFSLGFGPILLKKAWRGTEFRLCAVPFGGYVALPQLDPSGMQRLQGDGSPDAESFAPAAWWKRVIVSVAGPFCNVLLAVPLAFLVRALPPVADPRLDFGGAVVGAVQPGSAAEDAGLRPGDQILKVAEHGISSWPDFVQEVHLLSGEGSASLVVSNRLDGEVRAVSAAVSRSSMRTWRIDGLAQASPVGVGELFPGSAAAAAGLETGDAILSANGARCVSPEHLASLVAGAAHGGGGPVALAVLRGRRRLELPLVPGAARDARPPAGCLAVSVIAGEAAEAVGIKAGDMVLAANGQALESPEQFVDRVRSSGGATMRLEVLPHPWTGEPRTVDVTPGERDAPEGGGKVPFVGLALAAPDGAASALAGLGFIPAPVDASVPVWSRHRAPFAQLKGDAAAVWRVFSPLFGSRHKGELGRVDSSLGGPVLILSSMWMWVLSNFAAALGFVRFLNVNLAIVNLLPLPVLDGGHVVFALWRGATGREMPKKLIDALVNGFGILLIALFVLLSGWDAIRLWRAFG